MFFERNFGPDSRRKQASAHGRADPESVLRLQMLWVVDEYSCASKGDFQ